MLRKGDPFQRNEETPKPAPKQLRSLAAKLIRKDPPNPTELQSFLLKEWKGRKAWAVTMAEIRKLFRNDASINLLLQRSATIFGGNYPAPFKNFTVPEYNDFVRKIRYTFNKDVNMYEFLPALIKLNGGIGYNHDMCALILVHLLYVRELNAPTEFFLRRIEYPTNRP